MLSAWHTTLAWFDAGLTGMANPWTIAAVLALTTLLLEDLAIATGVALVAQGAISLGLSLAAVGGGIAVGDLALYASGAAATRTPWFRTRFVGDRSLWAQQQLVRRLASAVLLARGIPGLRLVTYTACGFVGVSLARFTAWVCVAVVFWTAGLYTLGFAVGGALAQHFGVPAPVAVAVPIIALAAAFPLLRLARRHMRRSARQ